MARILIADDDPLLLSLLKNLLEQSGHEVATADNGRRALELVDRGPDFALVITDIQMPEVDGLEVIRALRRRDPSPRIIAMSSYGGTEGYLHAARLFGADLALVKASDLKRLLLAVRTVLET